MSTPNYDPHTTSRHLSLKERLSEGDRIWYRRKGEAHIHTATVVSVRDRLFSVELPKGGFAPAYETREAWLDSREVEILDVEAADG